MCVMSLTAEQDPSKKLKAVQHVVRGSSHASAGTGGVGDKEGFGGTPSVGAGMPLQPVSVFLNSWHQVSPP